MSSSLRGRGGSFTMYLKHCEAVSAAAFRAKNEAHLKTLLKLLLLFVDYTQSEVDFIRLFEVWLHAHDLGESLFRMFQRAVAIVENTNAVPQLRLLATVNVMRYQNIRRDLPWDRANSTELAGTRCMPLAGYPSSSSNDL
jgi:hypothetical protein